MPTLALCVSWPETLEGLYLHKTNKSKSKNNTSVLSLTSASKTFKNCVSAFINVFGLAIEDDFRAISSNAGVFADVWRPTTRRDRFHTCLQLLMLKGHSSSLSLTRSEFMLNKGRSEETWISEENYQLVIKDFEAHGDVATSLNQEKSRKMRTICKTRHYCTYNHYMFVSNWVFIMHRLSRSGFPSQSKNGNASNLFQIHHTEQTPVVLVPKVVMRIVGKMPTTCCKHLNGDFPITFVLLHFAFQPYRNWLTKIDGNVGHVPRFYAISHQTCLLTSGALDDNSILMHSGQRCSTEGSQDSKSRWNGSTHQKAAQKGSNLMVCA